MNSVEESGRTTAGQFLIFIGLMTIVAGSLAILRTGEKSIFFLLMIPLGIGIWGVGKWLCMTGKAK